jgi:hypothetical protein
MINCNPVGTPTKIGLKLSEILVAAKEMTLTLISFK